MPPTFIHCRPKGNISKASGVRALYPTRCVHTISHDSSSVLSLASNSKYLFSGSQSSKIHVWDLQNFSLVTTLVGHRGSVLGLCLSEEQNWLFSCSGDGTIRVWDTEKLVCLYLIQSCHDVGDIFSMVYSEAKKTVFFGSQNTSIQWYDFADPQTHGSASQVPVIPENFRSYSHQKLKFFESPPSYDDLVDEVDRFPSEDNLTKCVIRERNVHSNAHEGYVYCLLHATDIPNVDGEVVISGSGDGTVKVWSVTDTGLQLLNVLRGDMDKGVLSMSLSEDGYLFCGVQGGDVQIWDLETNQLIRSLMAHTDDVLAIVLRGPRLVSASADGSIKTWSEDFEFREAMDDHDGIVLAMICSQDYVVTGCSDHTIKFWDMPSPSKTVDNFRRNSIMNDIPSSDIMLYILDKWVATRTVSGNGKYMEECRRGARFLKNVLQQLGATSRMIPGATGRNPLVYGHFSARRGSNAGIKKIPTVLVYGHYDVIATQNDDNQWHTDPFKLTGKDGYLYGRGTSDNKGPVLASIFAVYELLKEGLLDVNVIFLVEGEEESGSVGFIDAVETHKELFSDVDLILLSNSYWLGEDVPCLTYGLRGVIHASITISNKLADLHSGVEGGAVSEPLIDLIHVTGKLVDNDKTVTIPGFYDNVRPVTEAEERLYDPIVKWLQTSETALSSSRTQHSAITSPTLSDRSRGSSDSVVCGNRHPAIRQDVQSLDTDKLKQQLMARWRYPTLSVHKIDVSISNPTIIPRCAKAYVSMRVVPDQSIEDIGAKFEDRVRQIFADMHTENHISVKIESSAEYWLGNPESRYFKAVERAIEKEWKTKPLYIREGGSIPAVRFLEKFCDAPAVHLPMGQASDQAHLHNERICLRNLNAGRRIIKTVLEDLGKTGLLT